MKEEDSWVLSKEKQALLNIVNIIGGDGADIKTIIFVWKERKRYQHSRTNLDSVFWTRKNIKKLSEKPTGQKNPLQ